MRKGATVVRTEPSGAIHGADGSLNGIAGTQVPGSSKRS